MAVADVKWSTRSGKVWNGAAGKRDILLIASFSSVPTDKVYRKRHTLTEDEQRKLDHQGIPKKFQNDEVQIIKARYERERDCDIALVVDSQHEMTCDRIKKRILMLMNNCTKEGVLIHYIGFGKDDTGDWYFDDGSISIEFILDLYLNNFKGRVLSIVTDCNSSGSWVKRCIKFMDKENTGPCGHSAKEKGILIKVIASCMSDQVPTENVFSTYGMMNDKNTGTMSFEVDIVPLGKRIHKNQHACGIDFTEIKCCNTSEDMSCTMDQTATWEKWYDAMRVFLVTGTKLNHVTNILEPVWQYVRLRNDDKIIRTFIDKTQGDEETDLCTEEYGEVLSKGTTIKPSAGQTAIIETNYLVDYNSKVVLV